MNAPSWPRRWRWLALLGLLAVAIAKVTEDVVGLESGPVDTAVLWFVRAHVPAALSGFFGAVTRSGSAALLLPASVLVVAAWWWARRRMDAVLMATSMLLATLAIYALKAIVGRERPALWQAEAYWGSSFPSGHSLGTAAFATAAALGLARQWPRLAIPALATAAMWAGLVALSRLVLGVHWPSDVLAALCIGAFIPLALNELLQRLWPQA